MAQIYKDEEFVSLFSNILSEHEIQDLLNMAPGQRHVVAFGSSLHRDVVFVRATEHHMVTMSVFEFTGIK